MTSGKPLAWDVTVPDTYAASHFQLTSTTDCAAVENAAVNKTTKYVAIASTYYFVLVAIETSDAWCPQSAEFIEVPGKTDHNDYQRAAQDNISVPEDVGNSTARQCCRLPQHFPRVFIFYLGQTILTGKPYYN